MRSQHNIACYTFLLLWAGLLCLSLNLRTSLAPQECEVHLVTTSEGEIISGQRELPVAWLEPSVTHRTAASVDPASSLMLLVAGTQARWYTPPAPKPFRLTHGFNALTRRFRIQPNAP